MAGATPVGTAVPNLPTYFQAPAGQRAPITAGQFTGGVNAGGGNAPGVGIATGEFNPKTDDWEHTARSIYESQAIGQASDDITVDEGADTNDEVSFVAASGAVAPDAIIAGGAVNKTGQTLSSGDWAWGVVTVA
jgi:hypothetical protein